MSERIRADAQERIAAVCKHLRRPEEYPGPDWEPRIRDLMEAMGCDWFNWFYGHESGNVVAEAIEQMALRLEQLEKQERNVTQ